MPVIEVRHPLVKHKIGLLREADISTKKFRELTAELTRLLTYEACRDFELEQCTIQGWAGPVEIQQIKGKKVSVVPILRAGLGMLDGVLDLIPSAKVSVVGIARNHETLMPEPYFERFVGQLDERMGLIIDPMLATGGSMELAIGALQTKGKARKVIIATIIASQPAIDYMQTHFGDDITLWTADIDPELNEHSYIVPGLGDAGDLAFGEKL